MWVASLIYLVSGENANFVGLPFLLHWTKVLQKITSPVFEPLPKKGLQIYFVQLPYCQLKLSTWLSDINNESSLNTSYSS